MVMIWKARPLETARFRGLLKFRGNKWPAVKCPFEFWERKRVIGEFSRLIIVSPAVRSRGVSSGATMTEACVALSMTWWMAPVKPAAHSINSGFDLPDNISNVFDTLKISLEWVDLGYNTPHSCYLVVCVLHGACAAIATSLNGVLCGIFKLHHTQVSKTWPIG